MRGKEIAKAQTENNESWKRNDSRQRIRITRKKNDKEEIGEPESTKHNARRCNFMRVETQHSHRCFRLSSNAKRKQQQQKKSEVKKWAREKCIHSKCIHFQVPILFLFYVFLMSALVFYPLLLFFRFADGFSQFFFFVSLLFHCISTFFS